MGGGEGRVAFSSLLSAQDSRSQITFPPQTELRPCRWTGQRGEGLEETPFCWPECAPLLALAGPDAAGQLSGLPRGHGGFRGGVLEGRLGEKDSS